jgi:serine/threonine protein kinase
MPEALTQIGKYRIEGELGRGGMGVVYKAFDPIVERVVAVKTIRLDVEDPGDLVTRLRREAKSVGQLEHPNIVTLYEAGESEGLFYLAMQFIHGETLQRRIDRQRWFSVQEVCDLFRQICAGLGYAHAHGVVHRDIKPANIMITDDGTVKLTDFGIAKLANTSVSSSGVIVGTPSYMSPEQALGQHVDGRSDIFSLGSILYELSTGEKAFPGQNATTVIYKIVHESPTPVTVLRPGASTDLDAIVARALAKAPEQRYQTCGDLAAALELHLEQSQTAVHETVVGSPSALSPAPVTPAPASTPVPSAVVPALTPGVQPVATPARLPLAWLGAGAAGALLLVIVILLAVQLRRPEPSSTSPGAPTGVAPASSPSPTNRQPGPGPAERAPATNQSASPVSSPAGVDRKSPSKQATPAQATRKQTEAPRPETRPSAPATGSQQPTEVRPAATWPESAGPETFDALLVKGDLAFQQAKYQDALDAYSKAYRLNPHSAEARRKVALALTLLGRGDEARKYQ